ncbi:unnamed protein product [Parajaminaea phylloscopi]
MIIHKSPYPDIQVPHVTLPSFVLRPLLNGNTALPSSSRRRLDEPLIIPAPYHEEYNPNPQRPRAAPEGLSLTALKERSEHFALGLREQKGWRVPGRVLSIVSENQHDYTAAVLGPLLLGARAALHNPSYTASELAHQFRLVRTSAVLCSAKAYSKCLEAAQAAASESEDGLENLKASTPPEVWVFDEPELEDEGNVASFSEGSNSAGTKIGAASWFHIIRASHEASAAQLEDLWQSHRSAVQPEDDAVYCFSSGTSGKPKAVRLLHRNLVANVIQATGLMRDRTMPPLFDRWDLDLDPASWYSEPLKRHPEIQVDQAGYEEPRSATLMDKIKDRLHLGPPALPPVQINEREVHIDLLPFFHCYGLVVSLVALHTATPRYVLPRFSLLLFLHLVTKHKATFAFVVPPVLLALSRSPEVDAVNRGFDLSSLTRLASGAASLPGGLRQELWDKRGIRVTDGFGMSEMSPIICLQMARDLDFGAAEGSVGQLSASTMARVVDEHGHDVPTGEKGELLLHGPQMMAGYLHNDAANADAFVTSTGEKADAASEDKERRDVWLKTGDIVSINAAGYVTIHDRTKDVIKVKGFQVSPAELEDELLKDPLVHDVAVVGVLPEQKGPGDSADHAAGHEETPWAFCVPSTRGKDEVSDDADRSAKVMERLHKSGRIAKYKYIGGVTWVEALPKSDAGKVLKRELKTRKRS